MMNEQSYRFFFAAVSNESRCKIVNLLRKGPKSVMAICAELGLEQSRCSHSLKCLVRCGFANCRYEGKRRVYSLHPDILTILDAIDRHMKMYQGRLAACGILKKQSPHNNPRKKKGGESHVRMR